MQLNSRKIHVVIPARYASIRLPGKPLADICGKPMVVRVFESVATELPGTDVVVAVDDNRVAAVLARYGIPTVMTNEDHESGTDRVAQVARTLDWDLDDIILNVQGDEPSLPANLLSSFVEHCTETPSLEMATVSTPVAFFHELDSPHAVKVVVNEVGEALFFSRSVVPFSRDQPAALASYRRHLGIYGYKNSTLQRFTREQKCAYEAIEQLEQLRALWMGISISVMDWPFPHAGGVDTVDDLSRVRAYFEGRVS